MSSYRKHIKYAVITLMVISLSMNLVFGFQLISLRKKMASSNSVISTKVESAIRDTMHSIKVFKEDNSNERLVDLQKSVQQLVLTFNNWLDLHQSQENPSPVLARGLNGIEVMRNAIAHHLNNQYSSHNGQLTSHDLVFLDKIYEQLDRLLVVYGNVEKNIDKIKNSNEKDGGLLQWAASMEEITRLYRHSHTPNEHPKYMDMESALARTNKLFPELSNFQGKIQVAENVKIRDGVHYYEVAYYVEDVQKYLVWVDAIDGSLRYFEDYNEIDENKVILNEEALDIARNFIRRFVSYDQFIEEVSIVKDEATNKVTYAFQFTPVVNQISLVSDSIQVNILKQGGNINKYANSFSNTRLPVINQVVSREEIEEKYQEKLENMYYIGMAVVRSFYTHYKPVVTYNYKARGDHQDEKKLYFDVATGNQVYEAYSVYQPLYYYSGIQNY